MGGKVGTNQLKDSASGNGESKRGDMIADAADFPEQTGEQVLVQRQGLDQGRAILESSPPRATSHIASTGSGVTDIESPLNRQDRRHGLKDGRSVVVN